MLYEWTKTVYICALANFINGLFSRYADPNQDLRVYSKKDVRRLPSAPVLPSRDIFRRSNRSNNGIVASESGKYIILVDSYWTFLLLNNLRSIYDFEITWLSPKIDKPKIILYPGFGHLIKLTRFHNNIVN